VTGCAANSSLKSFKLVINILQADDLNVTFALRVRPYNLVHFTETAGVDEKYLKTHSHTYDQHYHTHYSDSRCEQSTENRHTTDSQCDMLKVNQRHETHKSERFIGFDAKYAPSHEGSVCSHALELPQLRKWDCCIKKIMGE